MWIQSTNHGDGSAEFTASTDEEDFKFSVVATDDGDARVGYEETLSWRGEIRVSTPRHEIFRRVMTSDKMTEFLEAYGLSSVRRERR